MKKVKIVKVLFWIQCKSRLHLIELQQHNFCFISYWNAVKWARGCLLKDICGYLYFKSVLICVLRVISDLFTLGSCFWQNKLNGFNAKDVKSKWRIIRWLYRIFMQPSEKGTDKKPLFWRFLNFSHTFQTIASRLWSQQELPTIKYHERVAIET